DHLHLDYGGGADPSLATLGYPKNTLRRPIDDPLNHLVSPNDRVAPTVSSDLHFRIPADDTTGPLNAGHEPLLRTHHYFYQTVGNGSKVLGAQAPTRDSDGNPGPSSAAIDILADAYDQFTPGGAHLGIEAMRLSIAGQKWGDKTGDVLSFDF